MIRNSGDVNTNTNSVELSTTGAGGGGGGSVTQGTVPWVVSVPDGNDVAEGTKADVAYVSGSGTVVAILKGIFSKLATVITTLGSPFQAGGSIGNTTFGATQGTSPWVISGTVTVSSSLTPAAPTAATIGASDTTALAASAGRKRVDLVNTSSNFMSIAWGSAAVLNSGWTLTPYGTLVMDDAGTAALALHAIASSAGSNLAIQTYS